MTDRMKSTEWVLHADQWSQTYYQFRDGKLFFVENDNKEQTHDERERRRRGVRSRARDDGGPPLRRDRGVPDRQAHAREVNESVAVAEPGPRRRHM